MALLELGYVGFLAFPQTAENPMRKRNSPEIDRMQCPQCGYQLSETELLRESAAVLGRRGRGAAKSRDPAKMREAGRLGGRARARNRRAKATGAKGKRSKSHS